MTDDLSIERDGHVATLTLNVPAKLNAITGAMEKALPRAWHALAEDPEVRAIVVTGAGERAFCSGAAVDNVAAKVAAGGSEYPRLTARQNGVWKPVVTAVNGVCAAAGLHFVADSDIVIASQRASFLDPHVNVGQVSALEPIGLARRIPLERVLRMVILGKGERIDAETAQRIGLVSEVVPATALRERALELARLAAQGSPAAIQGSLQAIWEGLDRHLDEALQHGWRLLQEHRARHPDASEGPRAFAEKRPPRWRP